MPPSPVSVGEALDAMAAADRPTWSLVTGHHDLEQVAERLRRVAALPTLPDVRDLAVPGGRMPLVAAHGPGFSEALAAVVDHRAQVWLIAPFRTALRLAEAGVPPDVIVLAERDTWPIAASLDQWRSLPPQHASDLSAATLVVDGFAPVEVVERFRRAYTFDSGLGFGTPLPLHGFGVLAAAALPLVLGHRRVGCVGVTHDPVTRLGMLMAGLAAAAEVQWTNLTGSRIADWLSAGPVMVGGAAVAAASLPPPVACARAVASAELAELDALRDLVQTARSYADGDPRLAELVEAVRASWRRNPVAVAAVQRASLRWLSTMWELAELDTPPLDATRSTRMISRLVMGELAAALANHGRDCRACVETNLGVPTGAAA